MGSYTYKIRLKISSKGEVKSGGARVISFVEAMLIGEVNVIEEDLTVNVITIYDKADTANISHNELKDLIKAFHEQR